MAKNSKIEWTNHTWSPIAGCSRVSAGCEHCYAEAMSHRLQAMGVKGYEGVTHKLKSGAIRFTGKVNLREDKLEEPLHWRKPSMVFVNSMSDLFHENVPFEYIDRIFYIMTGVRRHIFQILTKRPNRMLNYFNSRQEIWAKKPNSKYFDWFGNYPTNNIWLGVSCENQKTADERIPILLQIPAAVRWISAEPLLGEIDLTSLGLNKHFADCACINCYEKKTQYLDWIVVGGESGPGARPMHPDWVRKIRDDCVKAGVPFFFKQWGAWSPRWQFQYGNIKRTSWAMYRVGKKEAGRELDGMIWNQYPKGNIIQLNTHNQ